MSEYMNTPCPVCKNIRPEFMSWVESVNDVQRVLCKACDTIYFDRTPTDLPKYDKAYNLHFFRPGDIRKAGIMAAKLAELIAGRWPHPNILEVGAGNGLTVLLLRSMGFNAFGIDLDPALTLHLWLKFNIPVVPARFEEFNPPGRYHLIYSSHVIEHTDRPREFMKKAFDLLEFNGLLFLDTPDSYYYTTRNPRWHHFATRTPFEHCCLLGQSGLRLLARDFGFDTLTLDHYNDFESMQGVFLKKQSTRG